MISEFSRCSVGSKSLWLKGGWLVALLLSSGCTEPMPEVSGTVRFQGKEIKEGAITFIPMDGKTPTAGGTIKDGQYLVRVPAGVMKVSISAPRVVGKRKLYDTPDSPEMPVTLESLPARYNERTELQLEVKPGKNQKDFDLEK